MRLKLFRCRFVPLLAPNPGDATDFNVRVKLATMERLRAIYRIPAKFALLTVSFHSVSE